MGFVLNSSDHSATPTQCPVSSRISIPIAVKTGQDGNRSWKLALKPTKRPASNLETGLC